MERILALDPNAPGLRASARYQRSVEILTGALLMAEHCPAGSHDPAVDAARKELALRARPGDIDDAMDMNLDLAVKLWKPATNLCPSQQQKDEALDRVLAGLSRQ